MSGMMEGEVTRKSKSTFVCEFCNAIVATKMGSKDSFVNHMEEAHNIQVNLNVVMAIHFLSEEEKEKLMKTKRGQLEHSFGLKVDFEEDEATVAEEAEEYAASFQYPKVEPRTNEKRGDFLRRRRRLIFKDLGGVVSNMDRERPPSDGQVINILGSHSKGLLEDVL